MKILQVFDFLSLPRGGGTVDVIHRLSRALSNNGSEVTVCVGDYALDHEYLGSLNDVRIKLFRSWFNQYGFYIMPNLMMLNVKEFDVIHLHCYRSFQNVVICSKARKHRIPYIIDAHGSTADLKGKKQLVRKLYDSLFGYRILRGANKVIAETDTGIAEYKRLGVTSDKIVLLHPLIDTDEFNILPEFGLFKRKYRINGKYIILFVGRINKDKGIDTLVQVLYRLNRNDVHLVIVGNDDGFKPYLERMIIQKGMHSKVTFTGFLSGRDKLSAMVDADVLVQPSKNEAGARPSLEAILCGTPVIVSKNTGAGKEISQFDGGYLFDYGDVGGLTKIVNSIFEHQSEAKEKTKQAQEYIRNNLSFNNQVGKYEALYHEVLN